MSRKDAKPVLYAAKCGGDKRDKSSKILVLAEQSEIESLMFVKNSTLHLLHP